MDYKQQWVDVRGNIMIKSGTVEKTRLYYTALGWPVDAVSLNYNSLIPYLIKGNQELHARIEAQAGVIATMEARLAALENP